MYLGHAHSLLISCTRVKFSVLWQVSDIRAGSRIFKRGGHTEISAVSMTTSWCQVKGTLLSSSSWRHFLVAVLPLPGLLDILYAEVNFELSLTMQRPEKSLIALWFEANWHDQHWPFYNKGNHERNQVLFKRGEHPPWIRPCFGWWDFVYCCISWLNVFYCHSTMVTVPCHFFVKWD